MKRKAAGALLLAVLAMLAGCDGGLVVDLEPTAEVEGPVDGGDYRVRLGAEADATKGEAEVRGVDVVGYDATGREVCRADVGDLETGGFLGGGGAGAETVRCETVPSILLVSAGRVAPKDGTGNGVGRASLYAAVYLGQGEGRSVLGQEITAGPHEYETTTVRTYRLSNQSEVPAPTPDESLVGYAKCRQHLSDKDFGAIAGEKPWITQTPDPPEERRRYVLEVGQTSPGDESAIRRSLSSLPPELRDMIGRARETADREDRSYVDVRANVSRSTYLSVHEALLDRSVDSPDDVPETDDGADGVRRAATWDDRRANCRQFRYEGLRGHRVSYVVEVDGEHWLVELAHVDEWRGEIDVPTVDEDAAREDRE